MDISDFPERFEDMTPRAQRIFEAIANVFYDGDIELAFASARAGMLALYLYRFDGRPESQLTEAGAAAWAPAWISDDRLLYHTYEQGRLQVRVLNPESGEAPLLGATLDSAAWPAARTPD